VPDILFPRHEVGSEFAELRRITGSPLLVRIPFSLIGIVVNFRFFLWVEGPPRVWVFVAFIAACVVMFPALIVKSARMIRARGLLSGYAHPIVYSRWEGWLLIWPSTEEPRWRRCSQ
jgi:hypothetical protein